MIDIKLNITVSICYMNYYIIMFKMSTVASDTCLQSLAVFHRVINDFLR